MQSRRWTMQGRLQGRGHSTRDTKHLQYLITISLKRRIDPDKLFDKIVYAWKNERSKCKRLTIQCREKMEDYAIFLITANHEVVAQFPMPGHLLEQTAPLKRFEEAIEREKNSLMKKRNVKAVTFHKIRDLKDGMKRVSLKARVLTISRPQQALTRYSDYVLFANATLTDETGNVKLALWDKRANSLSINDIIEIENARVTAYRGETQLQIGKQGRIRVIENAYV
ncbi:MAG: hypothetical protein JSV85_02830 [Candidatus Bathyarchaeota archaeon]|nr:MAG: hypothetical protein JSV85_02830 [Candidatus Bathyarchaeota archaeon]